MLEARLNRLLFGLISTLTLPFALVFAFFSPKLRDSLAERLLGGSW